MHFVAFRHSDRRLFARLVCLVRGGDTAHCETAMGAHDMPAAWCVSASWLDGGVRGKTIDLSDAAKWRVYRLNDDAHVDLRRWLLLHDNWGYDLLGLLGILWRPIGHSRRRMFCSEACADLLQLPEPELYDPRTLESVVRRLGQRVQWSGNTWTESESAK